MLDLRSNLKETAWQVIRFSAQTIGTSLKNWANIEDKATVLSQLPASSLALCLLDMPSKDSTAAVLLLDNRIAAAALKRLAHFRNSGLLNQEEVKCFLELLEAVSQTAATPGNLLVISECEKLLAQCYN